MYYIHDSLSVHSNFMNKLFPTQVGQRLRIIMYTCCIIPGFTEDWSMNAWMTLEIAVKTRPYIGCDKCQNNFCGRSSYKYSPHYFTFLCLSPIEILTTSDYKVWILVTSRDNIRHKGVNLNWGFSMCLAKRKNYQTITINYPGDV